MARHSTDEGYEERIIDAEQAEKEISDSDTPHRMITLGDLEAVKQAAIRDHARVITMPNFRTGGERVIRPFQTAEEVIIERIEPFTTVYSQTPDHIGEVEVTYSPSGARAIYGVTDAGEAVIYMD